MLQGWMTGLYLQQNRGSFLRFKGLLARATFFISEMSLLIRLQNHFGSRAGTLFSKINVGLIQTRV
jgi:hypothetical protein